MSADPPVPVVVCISDSPAERARLAARFDGAGVLVLAPDAGSAGAFLRLLHDAGPATGDVVNTGELHVDLVRHEASWHGRALALTSYELKVLGCLAGQPGRVWTYRQLHERVWEGKYFAGPAALQSVIKRLRAKLRSAGAGVQVRAARGVGFRLDHSP